MVSNGEARNKYRELREVYECQLGKRVSDSTWSRVVQFLQDKFGLQLTHDNARTVVLVYAGMKRKYGNFSGRGDYFKERFELFELFYSQKEPIRGKDFLETLFTRFEISANEAPRSTKYSWFSRAQMGFNAQESYSPQDLALVAFIAGKWFMNKINQKPEHVEVIKSSLYQEKKK